jgi:hypothetical protein
MKQGTSTNTKLIQWHEDNQHHNIAARASLSSDQNNTNQSIQNYQPHQHQGESVCSPILKKHHEDHSSKKDYPQAKNNR